jgi:heat shock protein HtpX
MQANSVKTVLLLGLLTGLLVMIGSALGGTNGMIIAFIFAIALNMGAWWFSDSIALKFSGAKEVSEAQAPELHRMVAVLAERAKLPKPRVYIIDSPMPNAFATGRSPEKGVVAVTTGITQILTRDELSGVIAHELAHIKHRDTLISSIAATIGGAISMLADMAMWSMIFGGFGNNDEDSPGGVAGGLLTLILAPIAALLIQMAISRSREFVADEGGARILGDPLPLANALEKLETWQHSRFAQPAHVNPATAHMYIVNPMMGGGLAGLFRTHPPTAERIARLRAMSEAVSWRGSRAQI